MITMHLLDIQAVFFAVMQLDSSPLQSEDYQIQTTESFFYMLNVVFSQPCTHFSRLLSVKS
jgi:hypothetical protein